LRAGAHNVIGALWEVSDESAPRLMDAMYQGLQDGLPPSAALRAAKLQLLHGAGTETGEFRRPFFWGSFQLYTAGGSR
jgi:CHAT domain-containing protein